jgi:hypothetical protein
VAAASWFEETSLELLALQGVWASGKKELLALDNYASHSAAFYTEYDPDTKDTIGTEFARRFRMKKCPGNPKRIFREIRRALNRGDERAWMILGSDQVIHKVDATWPRDLERIAEYRVGKDNALVLGVKKRAKAASAP